MKIAFYKGEGNFFNKLIRWWTDSQITHVELIIDDVWYSSSHRDGGVRGKVITPNPDNWDIYYINVKDEYYAKEVISNAMGCGYDWTGIIGSQILPFSLHWPGHYFCSEIVAEALMIDKANRYAPHELFERLVDRNQLSPLNEGFFMSKDNE